VLTYRYNGKNISDVLNMTVAEALSFFKSVESILKNLSNLNQVGLGYITLGQSLDTLSGGEGQRLKLSQRLSLKGNTYIFDEPTRGLHSKDTRKIMDLLQVLANSENTVIIIEHNLDVISEADWIIDLGPEGGKNGGKILYQGDIDGISAEISVTGKYLKHDN
jgi:excinuclease UvrABC ATPase subunit